MCIKWEELRRFETRFFSLAYTLEISDLALFSVIIEYNIWRVVVWQWQLLYNWRCQRLDDIDDDEQIIWWAEFSMNSNGHFAVLRVIDIVDNVDISSFMLCNIYLCCTKLDRAFRPYRWCFSWFRFRPSFHRSRYDTVVQVLFHVLTLLFCTTVLVIFMGVVHVFLLV